MKNTLVVKDMAELNGFEAQVVRSGKALALELAVSCRRCIDDWDRRGEKESVHHFLRQMQDHEFGYHPVDANERTSVDRQIRSTFACLAAFSALRWLFQNHPEIQAYNLSLLAGDSGFIESADPKDAVAARALHCSSYSRGEPLFNRRMDSAELSQLVHESTATLKYTFVSLEGVQGGDYQRVKERDGMIIMAQKELAMLAHDKQETA